MKFILNAPMLKVNIEHKDVSLQWSVSVFDRSTLVVDFDMFEHINSYLAYCTPEVQDQVFEIFKIAYVAFDEVKNITLLSGTIRELVAKMYELLPLEHMRYWLLTKSNVFIPDTLENEYIQNNDQPGSREQTYLREDYVQLVTFSLALRLMIPIWGEFIYRTRDENGTVFKEYYAYLLLSQSPLANCPATIKLRQYVESNIPSEVPSSAIVFGLSTEDYPLWILALVVVRRVCNGDIRGTDITSHKLVTYVYKFIIQKVKGSDNSFAGRVISINTESKSTDDDSGGSKFEAYKIRRDIIIGDKVYITNMLEDAFTCAKNICETVDMERLSLILERTKKLESEKLSKAAITIVQWVYKKIVPPKSFSYVPKSVVVKCLAVTEAVLWEWKFYDIAALITAAPLDSSDKLRMMTPDFKKYLPILNEYYPHHRRPSSRSQAEKPVNHTVVAIETLVDIFNQNDWYLTLAKEDMKFLDNQTSRRMYTPPNLKTRLAQLLIEKIQAPLTTTV